MISLTGGQWALICLAAFLIGVSKTGIAGLNILAIAIFASVLPARQSVGAVLIAFLGGDLVAVMSYRHDAHWQHLWRLFPWAGLGVVIGALALGRIPDAGVRRLIGGILLALIIFYLLRQYASRNGDAELIPFTRHPWLIGLTGILAGFTTMVANASGPIMVLYLLALRLPKVAFIGTAALVLPVPEPLQAPVQRGLGIDQRRFLRCGFTADTLCRSRRAGRETDIATRQPEALRAARVGLDARGRHQAAASGSVGPLSSRILSGTR